MRVCWVRAPLFEVQGILCEPLCWIWEFCDLFADRRLFDPGDILLLLSSGSGPAFCFPRQSRGTSGKEPGSRHFVFPQEGSARRCPRGDSHSQYHLPYRRGFLCRISGRPAVSGMGVSLLRSPDLSHPDHLGNHPKNHRSGSLQKTLRTGRILFEIADHPAAPPRCIDQPVDAIFWGYQGRTRLKG